MNNTQYEKMIKSLIDEIENLENDKNFQRMREIYSYKDPSGSIMQQIGANIAKRVATYGEIANNFTSDLPRRGAWDFKPKAKDELDSFIYKDADGKESTVFGFKMPGDDTRVYDHDILGNILYAYIQKEIGLPSIENWGAAFVDDAVQYAKNKFKNPENTKWDNFDERLVWKSLSHFTQNPNKPTLESLMSFIDDQSKQGTLRSYNIDQLTPRSVRAKEGEKLADIAARSGRSVAEIMEQLEKDAKLSDIYKGINEDTILTEGRKLNLPVVEKVKEKQEP